jgi:hypothetical protein
MLPIFINKDSDYGKAKTFYLSHKKKAALFHLLLFTIWH